ncbi:MAG: LytTR family DNA-binding domain-containing protein [Oscillospiraceae bacterium]|nr:LytTR family DNA-binding domain-containing protein [Oscillospiraceae bacterium]
MSLRIVIADDDAGMRLVLRGIIESMDGMQLVGEAEDGAEAVRCCLELKPDVVFMDVQMPIMDGVSAMGEIMEVLPDTIVVFCTAYSEYMQDAFAVYAADYLIKPFKTDRVRQTLRRISNNRAKSKIAPARSLVLKNRDGMAFLPMNEILLIYREGRQTVIVTQEGAFTTSESLNELVKKLEGNDFYRGHRAYIVNISAITAIHPYGRWTYIISLKGTDKTALITQEKLDELQRIMGV